VFIAVISVDLFNTSVEKYCISRHYFVVFIGFCVFGMFSALFSVIINFIKVVKVC